MKSVSQKLLRDDVQPHPIIDSIREVCRCMDAAQSRFEQETDPDLVEAGIYEMQALRAKYRYLLRVARNEGITCQEKTYLWSE